MQRELEGLVSILPALFEEVVQKLKETDSIDKAVTFYHTFLAYSLSAKVCLFFFFLTSSYFSSPTFTIREPKGIVSS